MKSLAIIGTGIAGMSAGYFLRSDYDITFYEKNDYPGGHTNTLKIFEDNVPVYIDSGFIVYNEVTYPNLVKFFKALNIPTQPTSMSFSVQHVPSGLEYCGTGLSGLFAQRKNLFRPRFWRLLLDMDRFNKSAPLILEEKQYQDYSMERYIRENNYSDDFLNHFVIPMGSAVWSTPPDLMLKFPAVTLIRFFKNHGFLGLSTHYQWRTVTGGSRIYRDKVLSMFEAKVRLNAGVLKVNRAGEKVRILDQSGYDTVYDKVIIAAHADEALEMLAAPTENEQKLLGAFKYQKNHAVLHTDASIMPKTKEAWSSWNYRIIQDKNGAVHSSTIYDMNSLQNVSKKRRYFISINEMGEIDPKTILWQKDYYHPLFDVKAIQAQEKLDELNQNQMIYFCGSYFKYGFHEDALNAGIAIAQKILGKENVWT